MARSKGKLVRMRHRWALKVRRRKDRQKAAAKTSKTAS